MDFDRASKDLKIDKKIYLRIFTAAVTQTEADFPAIQEALTRGDGATVQSISHRWKGDFANLRVDALASIAQELNRAVKAGAASPILHDHFLKFKNLFNQLKQELNQNI